MAGFGNFGGKIGKAVKKIDPLRGGDKLLEGAGLPTFTGEGDKNIFNALSPTPPKVEMPKQEKQIVMPTADDEKISEARRRSLARQRQLQGRASTILTDNSETLG